MLFSKLLIPTLKDAPQEAEVISHKLMLRAGMIRKVASGIYTWLPLGLKVLKKIENIVREEMDASGELKKFSCQWFNQKNYGMKQKDGKNGSRTFKNSG